MCLYFCRKSLKKLQQLKCSVQNVVSVLGKNLLDSKCFKSFKQVMCSFSKFCRCPLTDIKLYFQLSV